MADPQTQLSLSFSGQPVSNKNWDESRPNWNFCKTQKFYNFPRATTLVKKNFSDYEPIFKLGSFFEGCAGNPKISAPLALQMFLENCFLLQTIVLIMKKTVPKAVFNLK